MYTVNVEVKTKRDIHKMQLGETAKIAQELITGDRQESYDCPAENFARISNIYFSISGMRLQPKEIALLMVAVKLGRNRHSQDPDNIIDAIGYLDIYNSLNQTNHE